MIWRASDYASDHWKSFRSDYFDVSFSSSLRLEDTPLESREAKVFVNLVLTCAPQFVITTVFDA